MSTIRYKGKDQIGVRYKQIGEAAFGVFYTGVDPGAYISPVTELVPTFDPEIQAIYALRTGATAGEPLALLSKRSVVKLRLSWIQQNMNVQYYQYWQRWFLKDPPAESTETNFCLEAQTKRDDSNLFFLKLTGLKWNIVTIRGSIGEPVVWTAECVGKSLTTSTSSGFSGGYQEELTSAPWIWKDYYIQYDAGGGYALFPDVTDFEVRVEKNLKPNYCFNSTGSLELVSLEPQEYRVTARLTANLTSKTFLDALLAGTETKLKLLMPDSKYIEMTGGRFRAVEPTLRPEDLIAHRIEYEAKSWSHAFT